MILSVSHTHFPGQLQMVMASQAAAPTSLQNSSPDREINTETTALQALLLRLLISVKPAYCSILSSTPGRGTIKSTRSTQPSIPPG